MNKQLEEILEQIRTTNPMSLDMNKLIKELITILNKEKNETDKQSGSNKIYSKI